MIEYEKYIDGLINKDNESFRIVYESTKKGVFSIIISIVNNKAVAEDLMQDTYMKMIQKIHLYKRGKSFYPWLLQIAKNTAYDYYRKEKKNLVLDPIEKKYIFERASKDTSTYAVNDLIKSLNETEKEVILLRIVGNTKFKDIALTLNKPLGTILWIYNKAIKKLKNTL